MELDLRVCQVLTDASHQHLHCGGKRRRKVRQGGEGERDEGLRVDLQLSRGRKVACNTQRSGKYTRTILCEEGERERERERDGGGGGRCTLLSQVPSPLTFLYFSSFISSLTSLMALVISGASETFLRDRVPFPFHIMFIPGRMVC